MKEAFKSSGSRDFVEWLLPWKKRVKNPRTSIFDLFKDEQGEPLLQLLPN